MANLYETTYQDPRHFSFGKNWQLFLAKLNDERITRAKQSLTDFLGGSGNLENKTFIDIGCGSGLFSLAAFLLGAKQVISVDIDDFSLECVKYLRERFAGQDKNRWIIKKGSALDKEFIKSLGQFDIVYSWGVLHHTGEMWRAIEYVMSLVEPNGLFYLAIYNEPTTNNDAQYWLTVKRRYNSNGAVMKKFLEWRYALQAFYGAGCTGHRWWSLQKACSHVIHYNSFRGMDWYTDIKDWLGGYPYEFCNAQKMIDFFESHNFKTLRVKDVGQGTGCNEFLFRFSL